MKGPTGYRLEPDADYRVRVLARMRDGPGNDGTRIDAGGGSATRLAVVNITGLSEGHEDGRKARLMCNSCKFEYVNGTKVVHYEDANA